jgi:pimeloyl-ACP methyl ester carboxylesterase
MQTVTSRDGTRIAFWRTGVGPPLLLVHGATADHTTTWRTVLPALERHVTVYAMDRRGRGGSGDAPAYCLQREAEDVAAVVDAIGGSVSVLGHSYGALCTLEASLLTRNAARLILYEGVYLRGRDVYPPGLVERMDRRQAQDDTDGILETLFLELVEMPAEDFELLRGHRESWAVRQAVAPTIPRELAADEGYILVPDRFRDMDAPTLFLVGGDSPPREAYHAAAVARQLPNARVRILSGQQHVAMHTAPEDFAREVHDFVRAPD